MKTELKHALSHIQSKATKHGGRWRSSISQWVRASVLSLCKQWAVDTTIRHLIQSVVDETGNVTIFKMLKRILGFFCKFSLKCCHSLNCTLRILIMTKKHELNFKYHSKSFETIKNCHVKLLKHKLSHVLLGLKKLLHRKAQYSKVKN